MSATNRGSKRRPSDFYPTPEDTIHRFLSNYPLKERNGKRIILEPCAGSGNISKVIKQFYPDCIMDQVEIRAEEKENLLPYGNVYIEDFLKWKPSHTYTTIITNPPFSLAREFIEKCFEIAAEDTEIIMLLRLAFLESRSRYEFWQRYPLTGLYVLSERPSFTGKGTDATAYAWFVWSKNKQKDIKVI